MSGLRELKSESNPRSVKSEKGEERRYEPQDARRCEVYPNHQGCLDHLFGWTSRQHGRIRIAHTVPPISWKAPGSRLLFR